jgi:hypothetical protein
VRALGVLVVGVLAGCGPALDPELAGTWGGIATYSFAGLAPVDVAATVTTVIEPLPRFIGVCPSGSGSVALEGDGTHATWNGRFSCPPVAFGGCDAITVFYSNGDVELPSRNVLQATAIGLGDGCGTSRNLVVSFTGLRQ